MRQFTTAVRRRWLGWRLGSSLKRQKVADISFQGRNRGAVGTFAFATQSGPIAPASGIVLAPDHSRSQCSLAHPPKLGPLPIQASKPKSRKLLFVAPITEPQRIDKDLAFAVVSGGLAPASCAMVAEPMRPLRFRSRTPRILPATSLFHEPGAEKSHSFPLSKARDYLSRNFLLQHNQVPWLSIVA